MSNKTRIVHIIHRDKFTVGYINFMRLKFPEWEHIFLTREYYNTELDIANKDNIYYFLDSEERTIFNSGSKYLELFKDCNKVIISGLYFHLLIRGIPADLIRKTYLQFWGGDFYSFRFREVLKSRTPRAVLRWFKRRHFMGKTIRNCAGTINLIPSDVDALCEIFPNNTKHFVAPMPSDPLKTYEFDSLIGQKKDSSTIRIVVGNSAQIPNNHIPIFKTLQHLTKYDIEIVSPLSYGAYDKESTLYRDKVIKAGYEILGDKFKPVTEFMPIQDYINFLSTFDVGIFNQDRQAAMGNIGMLLRLGKKVYLREHTAMWKDFTQDGLILYPISQLEGISLEDLVYFPEDARKKNIIIRKRNSGYTKAITQWKEVLND